MLARAASKALPCQPASAFAGGASCPPCGCDCICAIGRRISTTSSTSPGSARAMLRRKKRTQPSSSASQPPEADNMLTPTVASEDNSGKGDIAQPGQVRDEGGRPDAAGQVLDADRYHQHPDIVPDPDLQDVEDIREHLQDAGD